VRANFCKHENKKLEYQAMAARWLQRLNFRTATDRLNSKQAAYLAGASSGNLDLIARHR